MHLKGKSQYGNSLVKSKTTCIGYQVFQRIWTPLRHQLLYLVVYHMLATQNHICHPVYSQLQLQEAGREQNKNKRNKRIITRGYPRNKFHLQKHNRQGINFSSTLRHLKITKTTRKQPQKKKTPCAAKFTCKRSEWCFWLSAVNISLAFFPSTELPLSTGPFSDTTLLSSACPKYIRFGWIRSQSAPKENYLPSKQAPWRPKDKYTDTTGKPS